MVKNLPAMQETRVCSLGQEDLLEKGMVPTPVFLIGEFHGQKSLVGYSPRDRKESDMTEWLTSPPFLKQCYEMYINVSFIFFFFLILFYF